MANKKINQLVSKTAILSTDLFGIGDATTGQLFKKTIAELQAAIGGAVISVNGLVGTVVLDTDDIQELATPTNKYFTDARARGAISLTVTGNSGASTYSSGTGVLNVPTYTLAGLGGITASFLSGTSGISYNSTTGVITYSGTVYTDASIRALLSGGTGISYNSSTGAISYSGTVYTDSSVRALISMTTTGDSGASTYNNTTGVINVPNYTLAGLGGISLTSLSGGTGITYNNTTGAISYSGTVYTDASVRALISGNGSVSYNNTTGVISLSGGNLTEATSSVLTITGGTGAVIGAGTSIQVKQASSTVSGFLSSTDWGTFNSKQGTITLTTTGTSGAATLSSGTLNIPQYAAALSGTTGYHAKFTSSTAIGNSVIYDNGTNVGIGTASPQSALSFPTTSHIGVATVDGSDNGYMSIGGGGEGGDARGAGMYFSGNERTTFGGQLAIFAGNAGTSGFINFNTGGSERMRILSTGKVGIGFTAPGGKLDVQDTGTVAPANGQPGTGLNIKRSDGVLGLAIGYHDEISTFYLQSNRMDGGVGIAYNIALSPVRGNVLIGTYTDNGYKLYVNGNAAGPSGFANVSDRRLKKDITPIESALNKVKLLNGVSFNWDKTLRPDLALDDKNHLGLIAQDVEEILPQVVTTGIDELKTKTITYSDIVPVLIEAIKELSAKVSLLENK